MTSWIKTYKHRQVLRKELKLWKNELAGRERTGRILRRIRKALKTGEYKTSKLIWQTNVMYKLHDSYNPSRCSWRVSQKRKFYVMLEKKK